MNWNNLKEYKCPKCGTPLQDTLLSQTGRHFCGMVNCGFEIGDAKYSELLRSKPKHQRTEEDNLSELNNL